MIEAFWGINETLVNLELVAFDDGCSSVHSSISKSR